MQRLRLKLSFLLLLILLISISGCSIGVKEKIIPIYCGFAKDYEETKGSVKIATNKKIPVTIVGETDIYTTMDLGGFIAIRQEDLKKLIEVANATQKSK